MDNVEGTTIKNIVKLTKLKQPTVTFHITEMAKQGLVTKTRKGKEVFCFLKQSCEVCPLFN